MCFHLVTLLSFFDVGAGCGCGCVGGHRETIHESVGKADQKIKMQVDNIAGVMLPEFKLYKDPEAKAMNILPGIAKGGEAVIKAKTIFQKALEVKQGCFAHKSCICRCTDATSIVGAAAQVLVALAGLQTSFMLLDEAIKVTNRRVNALEAVIIPKCENTVKCECNTASPAW